jgi:hypothetical protein
MGKYVSLDRAKQIIDKAWDSELAAATDDQGETQHPNLIFAKFIDHLETMGWRLTVERAEDDQDIA